MDMHTQVVKAMQELLKNPDQCVSVCWEVAASNPSAFLFAIDSVCSAASEATLPLVEKVRKLAYSLPRFGNDVGKIEFIKAHRILTGEGLKEAKYWVEANYPEFDRRD